MCECANCGCSSERASASSSNRRRTSQGRLFAHPGGWATIGAPAPWTSRRLPLPSAQRAAQAHAHNTAAHCCKITGIPLKTGWAMFWSAGPRRLQGKDKAGTRQVPFNPDPKREARSAPGMPKIGVPVPGGWSAKFWRSQIAASKAQRTPKMGATGAERKLARANGLAVQRQHQKNNREKINTFSKSL